MKGLLGDNANPLLRNYGIAVILILAVLRLVVYPLNAAIKDKKVVLADQQQTVLVKSHLLERVRLSKNSDDVGHLEKSRAALYSQDWSLSAIQADMLSHISNVAVTKGLTVSGFEIPEAITVNRASEVTVVLRLSGDARSCLDLLKSIRENKKMMLIKSMEISSGVREMNVVLAVTSFRMEV